MFSSVKKSVELVEIEPLLFESKHNVQYFGVVDEKTGYGGWVIAFGINAASATVDAEQYRAYSISGYFMSPTTTALKMKARVTALRDTKTFATRRVDLYQHIKGQERLVMTLTVDYHKPESATLLTYSAPPARRYSAIEDCQTSEDQCRIGRERGVPEAGIKAYWSRYGPFLDKFDRRIPPESWAGQKLTALTVDWPSPIDALAITDKTTGDYSRSREQLNTHSENVQAIAYLTDAGLAFIPARFQNLEWSDIKQGGSLEFSLRIFSNDLDLNQWVFREERTLTGGDGRVFVESRVWDEAGKMIAHMSQQAILRGSRPKI